MFNAEIGSLLGHTAQKGVKYGPLLGPHYGPLLGTLIMTKISYFDQNGHFDLLTFDWIGLFGQNGQKCQECH